MRNVPAHAVARDEWSGESWAAVRDKLVNGEIDAAHVLYGLIYGVHLGVGGPKKGMAVLMNLKREPAVVVQASHRRGGREECRHRLV